MELFWEEIFHIQAHDIDFKNKLKVSSIFNFMQDASSVHAGKIGVGYDQLKTLNFFLDTLMG